MTLGEFIYQLELQGFGDFEIVSFIYYMGETYNQLWLEELVETRGILAQLKPDQLVEVAGREYLPIVIALQKILGGI